MEDKVFGTIEFRVGWFKYEDISLWGKDYKVRIRTSSKKDELPSKEQQAAYIAFCDDIKSSLQLIKDDVANFILAASEEIFECLGVSEITHPLDFIKPIEVLFFKNGKYAVICNTEWSEDGMAVLVDKQQLKVDYASILEFEY